MLPKPADVFDRDAEWDDLTEFATSELPGLRIAVVYGRRRQGKSFLLRRLAAATGGLYHLATEQTEAVSLRRFADSVAAWAGLPGGALGFTDWEHALRSAASLVPERTGSAPPLLVLDEFPYLAAETPGLPSIVQGLYDDLGQAAAVSRVRLVLCGSAISVMSGLLSGTKALRGRAALELRITPFAYRDARSYWRISTPEVAVLHNALVGGTPGYRDLVPVPDVPAEPGDLGRWVTRNMLRPSVPLFEEANRLVHEDARIRDAGVYASLLAVIAAGESAPAKIGGLLGRQSSSLTYQLGMLESAGFIERSQDLLRQRRPVIALADPVVRFHHLVIEPHLADLEAGRGAQIWDEVAHTVESKIVGPHLETIAREWVARDARHEAGLEVGVTGQASIPAASTRPTTRSTCSACVAGHRRAHRAPVSRSSAR
ncbi:MAG: ATP-binding protein [Pseudonocardia sp.]|nr:ATP-binding protein [Pseudonocardia sp.]